MKVVFDWVNLTVSLQHIFLVFAQFLFFVRVLIALDLDVESLYIEIEVFGSIDLIQKSEVEYADLIESIQLVFENFVEILYVTKLERCTYRWRVWLGLSWLRTVPYFWFFMNDLGCRSTLVAFS